MSKPKIIYFVEGPPAYTAYADHPSPRPTGIPLMEIGLVIWGIDWADQIGDAILKINRDYDYEVWQPDYSGRPNI